MTNREFFTIIINGAGSVTEKTDNGTSIKNLVLVDNDGNINSEIIEFAKKSIAKLNEKNEKKKATLTNSQKENVDIKKEIIETMETDKTYTAKQITDMCNILSTQKTSALLKQLAADGLVKVIDGFKPENAKTKVKGYIKVEKEVTEESN